VNPSNPETDTIRLAKCVADQLGCSRAAATQYIEGGWISVDGVVVELAGARVATGQSVVLREGAVLATVEPVTMLFHKPVGLADADIVETATGLIQRDNRFDADYSGMDFLQRHTRDLTATSPLDRDASGLIVLTQDYRIVRKLGDEANRIEHEVVVEVAGTMKEGGIDLLQQHASWNGKPLNALKVRWQREHRLRFALKGLQVGMIKHLCSQVGLQVVSIKRIRIGRIAMASLPVGQWRYLTGYERF
jgi:23S rRNA pseudouridine2604 synthase